jgi:hypothetical protein
MYYGVEEKKLMFLAFCLQLCMFLFRMNDVLALNKDILTYDSLT